MLRKDIKELKMKYHKNKAKKKSTVNVASSYKPERSAKKKIYPEKQALIKAALIFPNEKTGKQSKVVQLNSNKSIGDNDSAEHSTIAQSTSMTSGYFKKAVKNNKKVENLAKIFSDEKKEGSDFKKTFKKAGKVDAMVRSYHQPKINKKEAS
mmetsp:Transcript_2739/g.3196  ORF Transcript_2739/g.3196 Transcript_2739/m.3196 type:complete len:152 (+) Transcript_2739:187-642(+)